MIKKNPLLELEKFGQSMWLDSISRSLLDSGELTQLIKQDNLRGITSNPMIFEKAIAQSNNYDQAIKALSISLSSPQELYEKLAIKDIQDACDLLREVYDETEGKDGFVSLEVSPDVAFDTQKTVSEGLSLWQRVNRPNLMIKVPATAQGIEAIKILISEGVNINVTLLFSVGSYKSAANAYLEGLLIRSEKNLAINNINSVASFFISRIDSKLDDILEHYAIHSDNAQKAELARDLKGKIAIANAQLAYAAYEEIYKSPLAQSLLKKGAHIQRLLWASTSTKNKDYPDLLYVDSLIAPNTVNTLPQATLEAFRDHGYVSNAMNNKLSEAQEIMSKLKNLNINFDQCCDELLSEGLKLFSDAFQKLLDAIKKKLSQAS